MARYDLIVIGGGLGGLSAAASAARPGRTVLLLEKEREVGGKCRDHSFRGHRFDIGPDYFSRNVGRHLADLGRDLPCVPIHAHVVCGGAALTVPPGRQVFGELRGFGLGAWQALGVGARIGARVMLGRPRNMASYEDLVRRITASPGLRSIFSVGGYFAGFPPSRMPAAWFDLLFGRRSGYATPVYPLGGSSRLPAALAAALRDRGGEIQTGARVRRIVIEGGVVIGVEADGHFFETDAVVSAAGLRETVMSLSDTDLYPAAFVERVTSLEAGLEFASVFSILKKDAVSPRPGVELYAHFPTDLTAAIQEAAEGRWPGNPPFTISLPAGVDPEAGKEEGFAATIKFLVPRGGAADEEIEVRAQAILDRAGELLPGFERALVACSVASPRRYRREWGIASSACAVVDEVGREKPGVDLPLQGLYAAGGTVGPLGGGTHAALESGVEAARAIQVAEGPGA